MEGTLFVFFILTVICLLAYYLCKDDIYYRALCHITNNNPYFNQKVTHYKDYEKSNEAYVLDISEKRMHKIKKLNKDKISKKMSTHS